MGWLHDRLLNRESEETRARRLEAESRRWSQVLAAGDRVDDTDPDEIEARLRNLSHGTNGG